MWLQEIFLTVFTQISEDFRTYFRFHRADHPYLGIIAKIFPPTELEYGYQFWLKVIMLEVEQRWLAMAGTGVNGLNQKSI